MQLTGMLIGLGNPGKEYERTRHNMGFMLVDAFLAYCLTNPRTVISQISKKNDHYDLWKVTFHTSMNPLFVLKPLTFMNKSGEAVQAVAHYYTIPPESMLVAHDEMDLPLGKMRLKFAGSSAGHNGIKSLETQVGTAEFYRLRLGIGHSRNGNTISHVLGAFQATHQPIIQYLLEQAIRGLCLFYKEGFTPAQQYINSVIPLPCPLNQP